MKIHVPSWAEARDQVCVNVNYFEETTLHYLKTIKNLIYSEDLLNLSFPHLLFFTNLEEYFRGLLGCQLGYSACFSEYGIEKLLVNEDPHFTLLFLYFYDKILHNFSKIQWLFGAFWMSFDELWPLQDSAFAADATPLDDDLQEEPQLLSPQNWFFLVNILHPFALKVITDKCGDALPWTTSMMFLRSI